MRRRIITAVAVTAFVAIASVGCSAQKEAPRPSLSTTSVSSSPISGAEAAAAYKRYLTEYGKVGRSGGANGESLRAVASDSALNGALSAAQSLASKSEHQTGQIKLADWKVQSEGTAATSIYVCEDQRNFDVVDASGKSIATGERFDYYEWIATIRHSEAAPDALVVSAVKPWTGGGVC